MTKFKLKRPIKDHNGNDVKELSLKSDDEISAVDFYGMDVDVDENGNASNQMKAMRDPIANVAGITINQVDSLHPSDYIKLTEIVGKFIE